jgi:putative peptide zinc metalloprotease protein
MNPASTAPARRPFPRLRQDLVFSQAPQEHNQQPMYILTDLVRHKFFRLGQSEIEELSQAKPSEGEPDHLVDFLTQNELITDDEHGKWKNFAEKAKRAKQGIMTSALHGYLYFRIPLINPEPLQQRLWSVVSLFFTRRFTLLTLLAGIFGLFFISRHWQEFLAGFSSMFSVTGLITYALAFATIKLLHEAGHAFMAYRFGIQVPTIGIAFMMFAPVLYTETSAGWRLPKRERMLIGGAGMIVEVMLAMWASLLWAFMPDGTARSILFAITTTGWFLTLAVNLNPLMRFDGYFLASDLVSVPNLQDRSFALARWGMRELLFAPGEPKPEHFSNIKTAGLIIFAIATWIYRLFLYLGIALLVYHFVIKLLGIFLFLVEITWFIALPLWRETKHWWTNRDDYLTTMAARKSAIVFILLTVLFFVPISRTISMPAMLTASRFEQIHVKSDARIQQSHLQEGKTVLAGDTLLELEMPDLDFEIAKANASIQSSTTKLSRLAADVESRSQTQIIEEEMARALQKREGLQSLAENKIIRAPFDGMIVNVDPALSPRRWIGPSTTLAVIKSKTGGEIEALATDTQVERLTQAATATFVPDDRLFPALNANLTEIERTGSTRLPYLELADINGGIIRTIPSKNGEILPAATYAKLHVQPDNPALIITRVQRGIIKIHARGESLATKLFRRIAAVLIMESGF